jgi:phosphoribosylanthranilate isomerase
MELKAKICGLNHPAAVAAALAGGASLLGFGL